MNVGKCTLLEGDATARNIVSTAQNNVSTAWNNVFGGWKYFYTDRNWYWSTYSSKSRSS